MTWTRFQLPPRRNVFGGARRRNVFWPRAARKTFPRGGTRSGEVVSGAISAKRFHGKTFRRQNVSTLTWKRSADSRYVETFNGETFWPIVATWKRSSCFEQTFPRSGIPPTSKRFANVSTSPKSQVWQNVSTVKRFPALGKRSDTWKRL